MRRFRVVLAGAALLSLAALLVVHWQAGRLERRIEARIVAEAARIGAVARVERVRIALWPPLRVSGLEVEKPGLWRAAVEDVSVRPRLRGRSGFGPFLRVAVGPAVATLPSELEIRLNATEWDWDGRSTAELAEPTGGLKMRTESAPDARRFELTATELDIGRLAGVRLEQSVLQPGRIDGELRGEERRADRSLDARFRVRAAFGECSGRAQLQRSAKPPRVDLALELDELDFARLFSALGIEHPFGSDALGRLHADAFASGPLDDPAAVVVTQQIDFKPPAKLPPALVRLGGDFVHNATAPDGSNVRIDVSPGSADFVARADVPALFVRTLLLAEDSAFFTHRGLDLGELPKAMAANWAQGGAVRGASTITQQLAKNLFLSREKSLKRKLQELALAFLLESALGKDRILEIYLNVIEWGPSLYGLRPAARHYFGKEPNALTPKETAFLVVMIPGPVKYQRSFNEGALTAGLEPLVVNLLAKLRSVDALSEEQYEAALAETLAFRRPEADPPAEP
jgi:hypothetical protein